MEKTNVTIIGAGVVGLAIAARLSDKVKDLLLVEKHDSFGAESSSRNSEVIHASVYYPQNSLKGQLCLRGNELMYDICSKNNIPHSNCGKLIVANDSDDLNELPGLYETARNNGAKGVMLVDKDEIRRIEPKVKAEAALYCPTSGIVDSHSLMQYFEAYAVNNGADIVYGHEVRSITKVGDDFEVCARCKDGADEKFKTRILINCAGLDSGKVSEIAGIDIDEAGYRINYHKGIYYRVNHKKEMFPTALIYPVPPEEGSVGIHTCPDLSGGMRLGPHFFWADEPDYSVSDEYFDLFYEAAKRYLPFLEPEDISADSSGIMPALQIPGGPMKDFVIRHEADKELEGFINLVGIESPGLTASPAIAEYVEEIISREIGWG